MEVSDPRIEKYLPTNEELIAYGTPLKLDSNRKKIAEAMEEHQIALHSYLAIVLAAKKMLNHWRPDATPEQRFAAFGELMSGAIVYGVMNQWETDPFECARNFIIYHANVIDFE